MKQYKFLTRFLISAFSLYLAWFFLYESWLKPLGIPDQQLTRNTTEMGAAMLGVMGYELSYFHKPHMSYLYLDSNRLLGVAHECNALVLFALFAGFIVCFPGKWVQKVWFSIAGIAAIWMVNILRVASLTLIQIHYPGSLDFNHKYTFTLLVYGFIFGLWMLWVKRISNNSELDSHSPSESQENIYFGKEKA